MKHKVIFMGTPEFAVDSLKSLHAHENFEIGLVITQPDKIRSRNKMEASAVKKSALELGLPVYETMNVSSGESLEMIDSIQPDFVVVVAFGQLLRKNLLDKYKDRVINVHASLLPKYRGAAPINWAILNGETETGISIMLIDEGLDSGDVLSMARTKVEQEDTSVSLTKKLSEIGAEELVKVLKNFDIYYRERVAQNHTMATKASKISKEMGKIDWNESASVIDGKVRGLQPWPMAYTSYQNKIVKIHKIAIIKKYNNIENGVAFKADKQGIHVNCKDACILMKEIQFPGKKKMAVHEYLNGHSFAEGTLLE